MKKISLSKVVKLSLSVLLISSCSLTDIVNLIGETNINSSSSSSKIEGNDIFNNINPEGSNITPKCNPTFDIKETTYITFIETVHDKNSSNQKENTIMLKDSKGKVYGPWDVEKISSASVYHRVYPKITLSPETYTILDSDTISQIYNTTSKGCGFARVFGYKKEQQSSTTTNNNTSVLVNDVKALEKSISTSGGTIKVETKDSPLNGLTLNVPNNAYNETKNFEISYSPIKENNFGQYINPVTPMIKIKNGGGYSKEAMILTIPISKKSDEFAMAFYYNEKTKKLEGIPIINQDNNSITVATRHFSSSELSNNNFSTKGLESGFSSLFVSTISESVLAKSPVIATGYKVGVDDWDFQNYGSFIAQGGHCAGQSVGSIWYYYEKKLEGAQPIHSLYDKEDSLWFDNPKGYKFASVLQETYVKNLNVVNGDAYPAQEKQFELSSKYSTLSWKAFIVSMLVTGEPQMVAVRRFDAAGNIAGGHALVAYKADYNAGKLYVVDPNFESQFNSDRYIEFDGNTFKPYKSAESVGEAGRIYTLISYWAKSSFIDYYGIAEEYNKLSNNTIGNTSFPDVDYYYYDNEGKKQPLTDDINISAEKIKIGTTVKPKAGGNQLGTLTIAKGKDILFEDINEPEIQLQSGDNVLGILVKATTPQNKLRWADFKYLNIKSLDLSILPNPLKGIPEKEYTLKLKSSLAPDTIYEWTFGDGGEESIIGALSVNHKYALEGNFTINVKAKDPKTNKVIAETNSKAEIKKEVIEQYPKLTASFKADVYTEPFITSTGGSNIPILGASNYRGDTILSPLVWNGNNFSVTFQNTDSSITRIEGLAMTSIIRGTVDFSTNTLTNIYVNNTTTLDGKVQSVTGFSAKDIPLQINGKYLEADIVGLDAQKHISSIDVGYKAVNWDNARIQIYFSKVS